MDNNDYDNDVKNRGKAGAPFVLIPGEVAFNPNLTRSDMFVFWMIFIFDTSKKHFFASNAYVAKKLNISEAQVTKSIARLKEEGYIKQISFDGRRRTIAIDSNYVVKHRQYIVNFNNDESFSKVDNEEDIKQDPAKKRTLHNTGSIDPAKKLMQTQPKNGVYNNKSIIKDSFSKEKENVSEETLLKDKSLFKEEESIIINKEEDINQDEFIICKQARDLISYWSDKGKPLTNHKDNGTKTYEKIKRNLIEVLETYSVIKVKQSIDHYYNLLVNKSTILKPGITSYPISLNLFLKFDSYSLTQIKKFNPEFKVKSWFKECLKTEKDLLDKYTVLKKNKYPDMTEYLKDRFEEEFKPKKSFTINDENNFIEAAKRINNFIDENNVPDKFVKAPWELIPYLFTTVRENNKNKTITPWNLSADWVYETQLPDYLERINVW